MTDPGWFVDQIDSNKLRFWDGQEWSQRVAYLEGHEALNPAPVHLPAPVVSTPEDDEYLSETGILEPIFLNDTAFYKERIEEIKDSVKRAIKEDRAIVFTKKLVVAGTAAQEKKAVQNLVKLVIRTYTKEAEFITRFLKDSNRFESALKKLDRMKSDVDSLIEPMGMRINKNFHILHVSLLRVQNDEAIRKEELAEQERDERAARAEIRKKKEQLAREADQKLAALAVAQQKLPEERDEEEERVIVELQEQVQHIEEEMEKEEQREANTQAGYVYVISNIGSLGEGVLKIGMTRRVEPMERVKELSDASVPFSFDPHLIHYSEKAREIEAELHKRFADKRVNLVNTRKEFFRVDLHEVRAEILKLDGNVAHFTEKAHAKEYRESIEQRQRMGVQ